MKNRRGTWHSTEVSEKAISNEHPEVAYEIEDASNRAATATKGHANNWIETLRWLDRALGGLQTSLQIRAA